MGGKDSIIVDADANLDAAVEGVAQAAFGFQGQKCSACSRAIVDEKIYDVFLERLKDRVSKITVGEPTENKAMGPVVSEGAMKSILNYIEIGKKEGRLIHGGGVAKDAGDGYFIQPTVIADIAPTARIAQEEIFGPVLSIIAYKDEEEAVRIANDSPYGLAGAVWSKDEGRAQKVARRIRAGQVDVNGGAFNMNAPFGGFKQSGHGREAGIYGLEEFLEYKSLQLKG